MGLANLTVVINRSEVLMHKPTPLPPGVITFQTRQLDTQRTALCLPSFARISRYDFRHWPLATRAQARGLLRQTTQECAAALSATTARRIELWPEDSALRSTRPGELLYADERTLKRARFDAAAFAAAGGDLLAFGHGVARHAGDTREVTFAAEHYPEDGALAWWTFFIEIDPRFVMTLDAVYPFGLALAEATARLRTLRRRWLFATFPEKGVPARAALRRRRCASRRAAPGSADEPAS